MQNSNNIKNEKSYFKKILTTASMLALVTGAASSAEATLWYDDGGNVTLPADANPPTNAEDGANTVNWSDNDSFYFFSNDITLTLDSSKVATIDVAGATYDVAGVTKIPITVTENSSIGSMLDTGDGNNFGSYAAIQIVDDKNLTLYNQAGVDKDGNNVDPGDFESLASITLGSTNGGAAATLIINNTPQEFDTSQGVYVDYFGSDINTYYDGAASATAGNITANAATTFEGALGQGTGGTLGTITANARADFNGAVNATTLTIADGIVTQFNNEAVALGTVTAATANSGSLNFSGSSAEITGTVGNGNALGTLYVADSSTLTLSGNVDSAAVTINTNSAVTIGADLTITGATTLEGASLDVAGRTLTHTGDLTIISDGGLGFTVGGTVANPTQGTLAVDGDILNGGAAALTINVDDSTLANAIRSRAVTVVTVTGTNALTAADITVVPTNQLIKWTPSINGTSIVITSSDESGTYFNKLITGQEENAQKLQAAAEQLNSVNLRMSDLLGDLSEAKNDARAAETLKRVIFAADGAAVAAADSLAGAQNLNIGRIALSPAIQVARNDDKVSGVAAGEWDDYGVWFSPFVGKTYQSERNNVAGYDSTSYGATLGFDSKINEDLVLGVSLTAAASDTKHKDFKEGDKTKFKSFLASVYNSYNLDDDWFMFGSASVGQTRVSSKAQRVSSNTAYEVADGKYTVTSFGIKEMFGYNYFVEDMRVAPMVGMKYTRVNNIKYQESGTTFQNLNISTKTLNKLEAIVGASVTSPTYDCSGTLVTPEAHGFVNYELLNNGQKSTVTLGAAALESRSTGPRLSYDLGLGVKAEYAGLEYSAGYDLQLADKRSSHQGTLKVRMNF